MKCQGRNDDFFFTVAEEKFLKTIEMEELYGGKTYQGQKAKEDKKKSKVQKAAIGFDYDNGTGISAPESVKNDKENNEEDDEDSDLDLDMTVDIMALNLDQRGDINKMGKSFGLGKSDFIKYLAIDIEEAEALKHAKEKEEEKAMYSVSSSDFSSKTFACTGFFSSGPEIAKGEANNTRKAIGGKKIESSQLRRQDSGDRQRRGE